MSLVIGIALAEAIIYIRVYAISGRKKLVLGLLSVQFLVRIIHHTRIDLANLADNGQAVHVGSIVMLSVLLKNMRCTSTTPPRVGGTVY